jgi:hypothetical protein
MLFSQLLLNREKILSMVQQISRYPLDKEGFIQQYVLTRAKSNPTTFNSISIFNEAKALYYSIKEESNKLVVKDALCY